MSNNRADPDLRRLARPSGALAMVALDQRESMRTMFETAGAEAVGDDVLVDFKGEAAKTLSRHASAVLVDQGFGRRVFDESSRWPGDCALVISADRLVQRPGEIVTDTDLDLGVDPTEAATRGAIALKLLVLWKDGENAERCLALARRFLERCRANGLISILEAIVRPRDGGSAFDREAAILDAARELGATGPDLYKAEVPFHGRASASEIAQHAERISDAVGAPWVVLSNGVALEDFAFAVESACRGGASGFLAGRAIWSDTVGPGNYAARLRDVSLPRLEALCAVVDEHARRVPVSG
jgi:sulfofructosephosphate aldolase